MTVNKKVNFRVNKEEYEKWREYTKEIGYPKFNNFLRDSINAIIESKTQIRKSWILVDYSEDNQNHSKNLDFQYNFLVKEEMYVQWIHYIKKEKYNLSVFIRDSLNFIVDNKKIPKLILKRIFLTQD